MPLDRASIRALANTLAEIDRLQSEQSIILDSLADRVTRMEALAGAIAPLLGVAPEHLIQRLMVAPDYHAAAGQVAEELRARCLPVVEWQPGKSEVFHPYQEAVVGQFTLRVYPDGWGLTFRDDRVAEGPETGEAGKAAAVAAWRRVCGLEAEKPGVA